MSKPAIEKWWKRPTFTKRVLNIVFDEGHCIKEWADFRNKYLRVGDLRCLVTNTIPFYVASATLPDYMILEIANTLHLRPEKTHYLLRSNDRPDIHLMVRTMTFAANSFKDLNFLVPQNYQKDDPHPPKFLVFFDKILRMLVRSFEHVYPLPNAVGSCISIRR
jgi:superfamily II DNA helicase RecQ